MSRHPSLKVVIEARAATDITDHALWIAAQGAPAAAARWVDEIEHAIASLATMPERCPLAPEAEAFSRPIRQLLFKSHRILFIIEKASVHILHVRHAAMQVMEKP